MLIFLIIFQQRTSESLYSDSQMFKMHWSSLVHWVLAVSFHITVATAHSLYTHRYAPQRSISFSPPSQHPIPAFPTSANKDPHIRGTIDVLCHGANKPIPVNFTLSSQVCTILTPVLPHIIEELSQQLIFKHVNGVAFPSSEDPYKSPLPLYLGANITHQLYRSKFMLAFSMKLSPLVSDLKAIEISKWRSIISSIEGSARNLDRQARERDGRGLGSALVIEAEMEDVYVLAEWRLWNVVDGLPTICAD